MKSNPNIQVSITGDVGVLNDTATHANVSFPSPWTSRMQTPIKRVPAGKLWGQPAEFVPQSYGGPQ